jgi:hypothetical protein
MQRECPSRDHLFVEYRQAVKEWVVSVNKLGNPAEDPRLMAGIEDSRFRALTAKAHYENHVLTHGCGSFTDPEEARESAASSPDLRQEL